MTENYACTECGMAVRGETFHPYLHCLLVKAGERDPEMALRAYGYQRVKP